MKTGLTDTALIETGDDVILHCVNMRHVIGTVRHVTDDTIYVLHIPVKRDDIQRFSFGLKTAQRKASA